MIDRADIRAAWEMFLLLAPAPIGALIGLRYATEQTAKARTVTWLSSCGLAVFAGPVVGSWWPRGLSTNEQALVTIVCAAIGMEILAGIIAAARAFARDPFGVLGTALDLAGRAAGVFRKGGQP